MICSDYRYTSPSEGHFTFSTIYDLYNGNHPVSGNRIFGYTEGEYSVSYYLQGADRVYSRPEELIGMVLNGFLTPLQFAKGDELWTAVMNGIERQVANSGYPNASSISTFSRRPHYEEVAGAIRNGTPLSSINCD